MTIGQCSVMKEIQNTEESIKDCYERINNLEQKLQSPTISDSKKHEVKTELDEIRKLLKDNEQQLSQLHKHNTKTFAFAAALCFIVFTIYTLYILVEGRDF